MSLLWFLLVCAQGLTVGEPTAGDLVELGELVRASRYEEAIALGTRLVDEARLTHGEDAEAVADAAEKLIEALYRGGRAMEPATVDLAHRALRIKEARHGPDSPELVPFLIQLGNLYIHRWENPDARVQYARATGILEAAGQTGDPAYAQALNNLGVTYKRAGDYAAALEAYERALAIREDVLGPEDPAVAGSLNNIANVQEQLGDYRAAIATNERALAIREAHYGPGHEWVGESLNNLATVLGYDGAYREALAIQERAVEVLAAALGDDHERTWAARLNLGILFSDMGDHQGAIAVYEPVLALQRERFGAENGEALETLDALATSRMALGELEVAERHFRDSLRIRAALDGEDNFYLSYTLQGLGECLRKQGRAQEASESVERALAIWEAFVATESPELSDVLHLLAELAIERGEFDEAITLAARSASNVRNGISGDHPLLARALWIQARAHAALGDESQALALALEAESISRRHLVMTMEVLSDAHALEYGASRVSGLDVAVGVLQPGERGARTTRVFDAVIRSRGLVLDEMVARRHNLRAAEDAQIRGLLGRSRSARSRLANLSLRGPGWEEVDAYRSMLLAAQTEIDRVDRELARKSDEFLAARASRGQGLDEVRSALGASEVLVAFLLNGDPEEVQRYGAFVLRGDREQPRFIDLGPAEVVDASIQVWREEAALGAGPSPATRGLLRRSSATGARLESYQTVAAGLRRLILDPIEDELRGCERIFVVPDAGLNLVALAALTTDDGQFLLETGPGMERIPAERALCSAVPQAGEGAALIVGDPDFGVAGSSARPDPDCVSLNDMEFAQLPGASAEAEGLVEFWHSQGLPEPVHLAGAAATELAFKAAAPGHDVIHMATHGFVLPRHCGEGELGIRDNPLLRSGLAFSGANVRRSGAVGDDDGILTAEEIAGLDLSGARWAVLSACDTGVGDVRARGEGTFGLARAFQIAGAQSVIMSLWSVDDEATREWMTELYSANVAAGMSTGEAVREASSRVLERRRAAGESIHPRYWAAFVASGDWR